MIWFILFRTKKLPKSKNARVWDDGFSINNKNCETLIDSLDYSNDKKLENNDFKTSTISKLSQNDLNYVYFYLF